MSTADDVFMRQFGIVLGLLVVFAFAVYFIADGVGDESLDRITNAPSAVQARIAPVGTVVVEVPAEDKSAEAPAAEPKAAETAAAAPAQPAAEPAKAEPAAETAKAEPAPEPAKAEPAATETAAAAAPAASQYNGQEVYMGACMACHMTGAAGAPKVGAGNADAWSERVKTGIDALYKSAIAGKGAMPAKGGRVDLDDGAIEAAVDYMLKETGVSAG